jgi:hypothetical protein
MNRDTRYLLCGLLAFSLGTDTSHAFLGGLGKRGYEKKRRRGADGEGA